MTNFTFQNGITPVNGPLMDRKRTVNGPRVSWKLFTLLFALFLCIGQMWGADYELYSGAISEGDYVIVYSNKALKNTVSSNRLDYTTVSPSNNKISNPDASIVWHIAADGNYWTIYNASISKYAAGTSSKSQGAVISSVNDYAKWTVTGSSTYEFENKGRAAASSNNTSKWLRENTTYGFACYTTSTGGALSLYKKAATNTPTITKSSSMTTLTYSNGSPVAQYFTVGGTNLTNNVTVTAPANGKYEVSTSQNSGYGNSVELSKGNGTLANTNVYIRLKSGLAGGNISADNISITSTGATAQTISVSGSVPYTITWMANGSEHATTYVAVGSTLALPDTDPVPNTCGCTGKAFYGWYGAGTSYSNENTAPSIAKAGDAVNANKTYYAVFADAAGGGAPTELFSWEGSSSNDYTTLTNQTNVSGTIDGYAAANAPYRVRFDSSNEYIIIGALSAAPSSVTITIKKIGGAGNSTFAIQEATAANQTFTTVQSFTPTGSTQNETFEFTTNTSFASTTRAIKILFTKATSGNTGLGSILIQGGGGTTYSNYATTCCTPLGQINGADKVSRFLLSSYHYVKGRFNRF